MQKLVTIEEASIWASRYIGKNVTSSNIAYLIQYGRIPKIGNNGSTLVNIGDLKKYYFNSIQLKEKVWKKQLGNDLNWRLSFSEYKESETTKHVHRLHPYKGKFIPQLVEYFLDQHTDTFKTQSFFSPENIILDPFCGSGTTLVQANELGLHAIGVDISEFNTFISNVKISNYDINNLKTIIKIMTENLEKYQKDKNNIVFENQLLADLKIFNDKFFPSSDFKQKVYRKEINELSYGQEKEKVFLEKYFQLVNKYDIQLLQKRNNSFLYKWFLQGVRDEIDFIFGQIKHVEDRQVKKVLALILSRTMRSCRATTHADLATLKEPVTTTYYCKKHGKICKPLFSIANWWKRYAQDTVKRIIQFEKLKTNTHQLCISGDSRGIDIVEELNKKSDKLSNLVKNKKISGIFSSPPYVGLIDYHEQHAYAYDLFGFKRADDLEIGPLYRGQGAEARQSYVEGIAKVLNNCKRFLRKNYHVFLVANDKFGLYPKIADLCHMKIVNQYKRPVLNRVEKGRAAYAEIIFHMKEKE